MDIKRPAARHVANVWKGREAEIKRQAKLRPHGLMTGSPPLTITDIIDANEHCETDHVGTSIVQSYIAKFTGTFNSLYIAQNAGTLGLPWYGDYVSGSTSTIYCSHTSAQIRPNSTFIGTTSQPAAFDYVATFSPITPDRLDLSPLDRPKTCDFAGSDLTEVKRKAEDGKALVNSAGDYHEGLPESYVPGYEFTLNYNVSGNPQSLIKTYSFTSNSADWNGITKWSGCIGKISANETWETYQGIVIKFYRMSVPFKVRTDGQGWNFQPFDYGYRYLDSDGNQTQYIDSKTGAFAPVFLDGSGGLLGGDGSALSADPVIYPAASGGAPAGYKILTPIDWTGASFPNPFA